MPRWGEGGEFVSSGRRGGCALVGERSAPVGRGADWRGEWVHLSSGPPDVVVPGPCGSGGVSPAGQLYQRDGGVGAAHAGGAAPAAGAGRGGDAGGGGCAGGGDGAAALTRAAVLEKDVGAQLASSLAGVEQRRVALCVAGGHVGAVLEGQRRPRHQASPEGRRHPHAVSPEFPGRPPGSFGGYQAPPRLAVSQPEPSKTPFSIPYSRTHNSSCVMTTWASSAAR